MSSDRCPLCLRELTKPPTPFGELMLCESCVRGNLANNLEHVGVTFTARQRSIRAGEDAVHQRLEVDARIAGVHGRRGTFAPLTVMGKLMEWVSPRAKTGDDIFDAHVRATGNDSTWLTQLLESDAVRTACIEITTKDNVKFTIRGPKVVALAQGPHLDGNDLVEMTRGVGVVVRQMGVIEGRWAHV